MGDAENVDGQGGPDNVVHPQILMNENPGIFGSAFAFVEQYGWFLLLGVVVCLYLKIKLTPRVEKMRKKWEDRQESRNYDPAKAQSHMEAMDTSRRRMQEKLDAQAARHAEQMKIKEEEKRKEKIADWEGHQEGKGYRSKYKPKGDEPTASKVKPKSKPLKQTDYNPLAGGSDSGAWRPIQRGGGGGGG